MVLQREPASAVLWGPGQVAGDVEAALLCSLRGSKVKPIAQKYTGFVCFCTLLHQFLPGTILLLGLVKLFLTFYSVLGGGHFCLLLYDPFVV
jgi:hypothetical protein